MITSYDIIKSLLRTEKGTFLEPERKYLFQVDSRANKVAIKNAVQEIYNVKVDSVHVMNMPGKRKRVRQEVGYTAHWKKAVVKLKEGNKIEIT